MTCLNGFNLKTEEEAQTLVKTVKRLLKPNSRFELEDAIANGNTVTFFVHRKGASTLTAEHHVQCSKKFRETGGF